MGQIVYKKDWAATPMGDRAKGPFWVWQSSPSGAETWISKIPSKLEDFDASKIERVDSGALRGIELHPDAAFFQRTNLNQFWRTITKYWLEKERREADPPPENAEDHPLLQPALINKKAATGVEQRVTRSKTARLTANINLLRTIPGSEDKRKMIAAVTETPTGSGDAAAGTSPMRH